MPIIINITAALLAYLMGSISSAIIVSRLMGLPDPRKQGSNNPGATNVLRIGGKTAAFFTLLGDMLKGFIPVMIAKWYGFTPTLQAIIALSAFLGHLYPIFFRFEGGKGVATALGVMLALCWPVGLIMVGTWLVMAIIFKYSSLASLSAGIVAPLATEYFLQNSVITAIISIMMLMLIIRHQENIQHLYAGTEGKISSRK